MVGFTTEGCPFNRSFRTLKIFLVLNSDCFKKYVLICSIPFCSKISNCLFFKILDKIKSGLFNNNILSYAVSIVIGIIFYLLIYLPIDYIFGHSMIIAITLLFITFIVVEVISSYIMNYKDIKYSNVIGVGLIILMYLIFGYLTYNPIKSDLFYDIQKKIYGIPR